MWVTLQWILRFLWSNIFVLIVLCICVNKFCSLNFKLTQLFFNEIRLIFESGKSPRLPTLSKGCGMCSVLFENRTWQLVIGYRHHYWLNCGTGVPNKTRFAHVRRPSLSCIYILPIPSNVHLALSGMCTKHH